MPDADPADGGVPEPQEEVPARRIRFRDEETMASNTTRLRAIARQQRMAQEQIERVMPELVRRRELRDQFGTVREGMAEVGRAANTAGGRIRIAAEGINGNQIQFATGGQVTFGGYTAPIRVVPDEMRAENIVPPSCNCDDCTQAWEYQLLQVEARFDGEQRARMAANRERRTVELRETRRKEKERFERERERAMAAIPKVLNREENANYEENDRMFVTVTNVASGRLYRVALGGSIHGNVDRMDKHGCALLNFCGAPSQRVENQVIPNEAIWLGQILTLKHNEPAFIRAAIPSDVRGCRRGGLGGILGESREDIRKWLRSMDNRRYGGDRTTVEIFDPF